MARGYPDYFGYSMFPGPGGPTKDVSGLVNVAFGERKTLIEISAKGSLINCAVYGDAVSNYANYLVYLTIDGEELTPQAVENLFLLNEVGQDGNLAGISYLNAEDDDWMIFLKSGLTFSYQFLVELYNQGLAGAVNIQAYAQYNKII